MVVEMATEVKWQRLGFVDEDDDVLVLLDTPLSLVLLTFLWGPLYKSCSGGRPTSVSTSNCHSCERAVAWNAIFDSGGLLTPPGDLFRLHFPSFPFSHVISSLFSQFHVEKISKIGIVESFAFISHLWQYRSGYLSFDEIIWFKLG